METLIKAALEQPSEFGHILKLTLKAHGYTIKSFSKVAGIPQNTLYKITLGQVRDFRMSTLRRICAPFNKKGPEKKFVAVITSRAVLDKITFKELRFRNELVSIKEYPAMTIEEVLTESIAAQKDGALGIICGPIAASNIEKLVSIPIAAMTFDENDVKIAFEILKHKM